VNCYTDCAIPAHLFFQVASLKLYSLENWLDRHSPYFVGKIDSSLIVFCVNVIT
jgi:hypothetical protein